MGLILLEALGALCLLVFIVWWTMFSGRERGELKRSAEPSTKRQADSSPGAAEGSPATRPSQDTDASA